MRHVSPVTLLWIGVVFFRPRFDEQAHAGDTAAGDVAAGLVAAGKSVECRVSSAGCSCSGLSTFNLQPFDFGKNSILRAERNFVRCDLHRTAKRRRGRQAGEDSNDWPD